MAASSDNLHNRGGFVAESVVSAVSCSTSLQHSRTSREQQRIAARLLLALAHPIMVSISYSSAAPLLPQRLRSHGRCRFLCRQLQSLDASNLARGVAICPSWIQTGELVRSFAQIASFSRFHTLVAASRSSINKHHDHLYHLSAGQAAPRENRSSPGAIHFPSSKVQYFASACHLCIIINYCARKLLHYESAEWKPAFLRQARGCLFFPLPLREGRKRVSIFDRETTLKREGSDPAAWSRA